MSVNAAKQQRDCQGGKQTVVKNRTLHSAPGSPWDAVVLVQCLPKSNQGQEAGISHAIGARHQRFGPAGNSDRGDGRVLAAQTALRSAGSTGRPPLLRKGSILFLPGRGDFYEKYLETLDHWARAGWRVTASDWRGQAGSGRLGADAVTGHIDDFSIWIADLAHLWSDWTAATPGPHVLAAHSMGGHLVLRAIAEGMVEPDGAVLSAPMLGFISKGVPASLMHMVAQLMAALGRPAQAGLEMEREAGRSARRTAGSAHP